MEYKPHTIGVLTSGGDAPGMNAALRAVTRAAISNDIKVKAIYRGYKGLIDGEVKEFTTQDVSGIIPRGGTIIKSARCPEFTTKEGREQAYATIQREGIEALIVIGGDGSFTGGRLFAQEYKIPVIGIPGTIDNDLWGTDATIGYDTALNTIMHCVDMLRDTVFNKGETLFRSRFPFKSFHKLLKTPNPLIFKGAFFIKQNTLEFPSVF